MGIRWNFASLNNSPLPMQSYVAPQQNASVERMAYTQQFQVSVLSNPASGGTVVSGGGWYNAGTVAAVQATADAGYTFAAFSSAQDSLP